MSSIFLRNPRIFVGGVDISRHVRAMSIQASVGELVTTTLTLLTWPTIENYADGQVNIIFDAAPRLGPLVLASGQRAIHLRAEVTEES